MSETSGVVTAWRWCYWHRGAEAGCCWSPSAQGSPTAGEDGPRVSRAGWRKHPEVCMQCPGRVLGLEIP